ncbi:putative entry exclusion protein TrbK-alt [Dongia sp.]|uniref:putative entry exclusion protein TrbK-alt n=1 Tax=Dongia sp. TaxID=1977262 RepID=UPI0037514389
MDGKILARLSAVVFVGVAITATVIELTRKPEEPQVRTLVHERDDTDALRQVLRRCRDMGEAATRDPTCLDVWAKARDRFLGQGPKPSQPRGTMTLAPVTLFPTDDPAIKESAPAAEDAAPVAQPEPVRPGAH